MANTVPDDPSVPEGEAVVVPAPHRSRRLTVAIGLALALAIVAGAWFVGGRQGFDEIGRAGINADYLPRVGEPAPDFAMTVVDRQGAPIARVRLSDFRGRPVWLNFWGSWCPPCRSEMPEIVAAYERLQPRGLVWLAVSLDEPAEDAAEYAALNGATFLVVSDPNRADTGSAYGIANFPTHILIDANGIVRALVIAAIDEDEIVAHAEQILPDGP